MKKYAVFARKTSEWQPDGDYTIWWFLNETDEADEAFHWYMAAKAQTDKYTEVQIVESINMRARVQKDE